MGQLYRGRVVRIAIGGAASAHKERLLDHLLTEMDGVTAHFIDLDAGTVTAYFDNLLTEEEDIMRALVASGLYPVRADEIGGHNKDGSNAC